MAIFLGSLGSPHPATITQLCPHLCRFSATGNDDLTTRSADWSAANLSSGTLGSCAHLKSELRTRRERPRSRAAEQRDEIAARHSITLSARSTRATGTSWSITFAA
jgi:hypothetical protein